MPSPRRAIITRLLVTLIWLGLVTLVRIGWRPFLGWVYYLELLGLWAGGLLGTFLLDVDHLIYVLAAHPNDSTSLKVKDALIQRDFRGAIRLLQETAGERVRLTFHNALFQVVFLLMCFWVLTSTTNLLGKGLVMAMALHLLGHELQDFMAGQEEKLRGWFFWPIGGQISLEQQKYFLVGMVLAFIGLNFLLI